jgi:hypothetical protein
LISADRIRCAAQQRIHQNARTAAAKPSRVNRPTTARISNTPLIIAAQNSTGPTPCGSSSPTTTRRGSTTSVPR